ncbi:MAG TPA: hypothetical protein VGP47_03575 [Parachlamydiaceae bacterium]|nr:hypothetical protein [Parachlamydiaceae bacterium]
MGPTGPQGIQGPVGQKGEVGPQGLKGDTGLQGPRGVAGVAGPRGEMGAMGPQGVPGAQGIPGEQGPKGDCGCPGECGSPGACGTDGQCGPTGPCGPGICAALSTSTNMCQQVCANSGISSYYMKPSVEFGGIKFDSCGICLPSKGLYMVSYGVAVESFPDACMRKVQFQLNLSSSNENPYGVQGSTLSIAASRQLATVSVLVFTQNDDSYLKIQNMSTDSSGKSIPIVLNANGGVNAFINVVKLQ